MMRPDLCAVVASVVTTVVLVATSTYVRGEDVGCCRIECNGLNGASVTVTRTAASECQASARECRAEWSAEPCVGAAAGEVGSEDEPPAQR